jgi:hypothetical protein
MTEAEAQREEIAAEDAEDKEALLTDPDEYHRSQRLRTIHERRRNVHKVLDDIDRFATANTHTKQKQALADAVSAYILEVETVLEDADVTAELPENTAWDSVVDYAKNLGAYTDEDGDQQTAPYPSSMRIFREVNTAFSTVKPLIEEDDNDEWEV